MKKKLLKSLVLVGMMMLFSMSAMAADGDVVKINETNFPDELFREYISDEFDTDSSGGLSQQDLDDINYIAVEDIAVTSLKGIENFTSLTYLTCCNTEVTELDVTALTELTQLHCYSNNITSLDLSNNTKLVKLSVASMDITSLDVSNNVELESLTCCYTGLTSLDVSNNTKLLLLDCSNTELTSLDISKNVNLEYLYCFNTGLTSLDISNNTELKVLDCEDTGITSLDTSNNPNLVELYMGETSSFEEETMSAEEAQALVDTSVDKENLQVSTEFFYMEMSEDALDIIINSGAKTLSVTCDNVEFVIDDTALKSIQNQINGNVIIMAVGVETELLTEEEQAIVGDKPVYIFEIFNADGIQVTDFDGGSITVTIPYTLADGETAENLVIYYLVDGEIMEVNVIDSYDAENELLTFTVTHFSMYAVGYDESGSTSSTTDDTPETGDTTDMMLYMMLVMLACGGIAVATKRRHV